MAKINWYNGKTANSASDMQKLCDAINHSLSTPVSAPADTKIVAVDNTNSQKMLTIGAGLTIENDIIKASGGTGEKKYFHQILLRSSNGSVLIGVFIVSEIEKYETGEPATSLNSIMPYKMIYECCKDTASGTLTELTLCAEYREFDGFFIKTIDLTTHEITESHLTLDDFQILSDGVVEL